MSKDAPVTLPTPSWAKLRDDTDEAFKRAVAAWGLPVDRVAITVKEFCDWARISRSTFYNLVASGQLSTRKVGNRTLVLCSEAVRWLESLPQSQSAVADEAPVVSHLAERDQPREASALRYLSAAEVAKRCDCSIRTVRRWISDGVLKSVTIGGLVRISEASLHAILDQ